jgi:hypothetical protein
MVLTVCEGLLLALELRARAYGSVRRQPTDAPVV